MEVLSLNLGVRNNDLSVWDDALLVFPNDLFIRDDDKVRNQKVEEVFSLVLLVFDIDLGQDQKVEIFIPENVWV